MALENQRYGRNKDTLVNKTYIESGEYKRKFDNISENQGVNKTLYSCAKTALKHRSGTETEDMYWIDGTTGRVIAKIVEQDTKIKEKVIYTKSVKRTVSRNNNLVTLHSHPHSMPPSIDDINSSFFHKYSDNIVVCHNGKIFRYNSNEYVKPQLYDLYVKQYIANGETEAEAQIKALRKLGKNHDISFEEVD